MRNNAIIIGKFGNMKKSIEDFIPDDRNFNKGTEYGSHLLEKSLSELGAGRSILVDADDRIIAGNKTQEAAINVGLKDAIVIETEGDELVAVRRTDMDIHTSKGRKMALADNAISKKNLQWDDVVINQVQQEFGLDIHEWCIPVVSIDEEDEEKPSEAPKNNDEDEYRELRIKFAPDAYLFVLGKLREHGDDFAKSLISILNIE